MDMGEGDGEVGSEAPLTFATEISYDQSDTAPMTLLQGNDLHHRYPRDFHGLASVS